MKDVIADRPLPRTLLVGLLIVQALLVLPHVQNMSAWIMGFFLLAVAWRLLAVFRPRWMPGRALLILLIVVAIADVLMHAGLREGRTAGTALLVVMLGLKLLEMRGRRDLTILVFLGFFTAMTEFLFGRSLTLALYLLVVTGALVVLLAGAHQVRLDLRRSLATGVASILAALPVAILLFMVFPRLSTPLWTIRIGDGTGHTGFTDSLQLGNIARLIQSDAPAFYVRYLHGAPAKDARYWRGLVLSDFDGTTWTVDRSEAQAPPRGLQVGQQGRIDYVVTMEPSDQPWLFVLPMPSSAPPDTQLNRDFVLVRQTPIRSRTVLRLSAYPHYKLLGLTPAQRAHNLALPPDFSPRIRQLAERWRAQAHGDASKIVQLALNYFRTQGFTYSLNPGVSQGDPIEDFLFRSKRGFCAHFASAFTLLMRAAGVPARVVVGYLGGEYNPIAGQWTIRQSDAHAWSEVWLPGIGWQREDPTAAVAPDRIDMSIDPVRSEDSGGIVFETGNLDMLQNLTRHARWLLTATDLAWNRWVIGYSRHRQEGMLKLLGLEKYQSLVVAVVFIGAMVIGTLAIYLLGLRRPRRREAALRIWERSLRRMRRAGLALPPWAGPQQVLARAGRRWPGQLNALRRFVGLYIELRYAPPAVDDRRLKRFRAAARALVFRRT